VSASDRLGDLRMLPALADTATQGHLRAAFARDAQAAQMWTWFARIAEIEGDDEAARLFHDMAASERLAASGHLDYLLRAGEPLLGLPAGGTLANLRAALAAQSQHAAETLPEAVAVARAEGFPDAASWLASVARGRETHAERLRAVLARRGEAEEATERNQ
jgi:rubrerythrin